MLEVLKKSLNILDVLILAVAAYVFFNFDYENLSTSDKIYIVGFGLWVIMLVIRIYIIYKNNGGKDD
ncbi:MAG: hypothetical protein IJT73_04355 [Selenomonadaceae bacterium]|nr:hypothetical protein [Selenomonadaceae bacterium]